MKTPSLFPSVTTGRRARLATAVALAVIGPLVSGAGLLQTADGTRLVLQEHSVDVVIDAGYARTEWSQTFLNPTAQELEAIYEVPLPPGSTLAEVRVRRGDRVLHGEVVPKAAAEQIYAAEKEAGRDAGKATREGFRHYRFALARLPAGTQTTLEVVAYQPVAVDSGVGTYVYPLEEGGTDEGAAFWQRQDHLTGNFRVAVEVRAGAPLAALRSPGFEDAQVSILDANTQRLEWSGPLPRLDRDFVLYYQLAEDLPGRVEVFVHKPSTEAAGTFLAVVTPGIDLKPLEGTDYVFVLDTSGSMAGKFGTLLQGVRETLRTFSPRDRFRIVLFNNEAQEWTRGWVTATPDQVARVLGELDHLQPGGGTNLFAGMQLGLGRLDADRACSYILVTDAVANQGITDPAAFRKLLARYDLRFFCFLLGNSANHPLVEQLTAATGGYSRTISNAQDIIGEILLARTKVAYQSLHDARFSVGGGARPFDVAGLRPGKIFRGEQLFLMGRYRDGGTLELNLEARLTGEDRSYRTAIELPEVETSRPELERLWALRQLREWDDPLLVPELPAVELASARLDLALAYQLVTEDTAMLLLDEEAFARHGIERRNARRSAIEASARTAPAPPARTDAGNRMTPGPAPSFGGGALDLSWLILGGAVALAGRLLRRA